MIKEFIVGLFFIEILLMGVFSTLDILLFYIMFEGILIPMFIIIGI
jgi:NADH:ubiquinone oxidoreductase subunit 4 (subunit M)